MMYMRNRRDDEDDEAALPGPNGYRRDDEDDEAAIPGPNG